MTSVSALLIVKNEEAFIANTLNSLTWCDEIVVIDAQSTDRTQEICLNPQAPWAKKIQFITQPWLGFSAQRNLAMKHAKHEWVFFLDGDETCSPELASRIQETLKNSPTVLYQIRRQEFFLKKPIHYGIWNPSYHVRLFPKSAVQFTGNVHEGVKSELETLQIQEPIIHVEDLRIERFMSKLNHYTTLQAQNDYQRGMRTNLFKILVAFPAMFYKNYIYYQAYRDGKAGFIISILEGISRTVRHLKVWQLQHEAEYFSN